VTFLAAHLGHYLWVLYVVPVAIVIAGMVISALLSRRRDNSGGPGRP
jgi:cytochrome c-type biogenesis protein CcmH/NrfF